MRTTTPQFPLTAVAKLAGAALACAVWSGAAGAVSQRQWDRCEYSPQSITVCTQIIESATSARDRAKAYWWRGLHHSDIKAYDRAIADFNKSIELAPGDASAFNLRGFAYFYSSQYSQAIRDFTRSLELDPEFQTENTIHFRGRAYHFTGDHRRAIADLTRVIESNPDENSYYYRAQSYFKLGDFARARDDLRAALKISPQFENARSFLALVDAAGQMQKTPPSETKQEAVPPQTPPAAAPKSTIQREGLGKLD